MDAKALCEELYEYPGVSLFLSMTSTDKKIESQRINSQKHPDLFDIRNIACENIVQA